MSKFWDLFEQSIIIQGIITLVVIGVIAYLYIVGRNVPQELWSLFGLIIGYYFGSKSQMEVRRTLRRIEKTE